MQANARRIEMDQARPTLLNRVSYVIVLLLFAAFCVSAMSVVTGVANADDKIVARHDDGGSGDDDDDHSGPGGGGDDDDDGDTTAATDTTRGTGASNPATNDTATGTNTGGDTATGTTRGTGASNTATNDTATGTKTVAG
jgi:hypothetical protein